MSEVFDAEVTVRRIRFANPETGWAVVEAAGSDGTPIALVGPLVHLEERERARIVGTWAQDSRDGLQVKGFQANLLPPLAAHAALFLALLVPSMPSGPEMLLGPSDPGIDAAGTFAIDDFDDHPHAAFKGSGASKAPPSPGPLAR